MLTSYTEQINAISSARELLKKMNVCGKAMDKALNDAASTIAALNLTKNLEKDEDVRHNLTKVKSKLNSWKIH